MKKLVSLFIAFILVVSVFAQNSQTNYQKVFRPDSKVKHASNHFSGKVSPSATTDYRAAVLNEGFESATFPPTGWTKTTANASFTWTQAAAPHSGTKDAQVLYDPALVQQNEWLISPSVNLTTLTTPTLNFWWNASYYWGVSPNNNYDLRVKVSTDGGTTWNLIWSEDSAGVFTSYTYYKQTISLAAYATATNFKVAFQYYGKDGASADIDDISIDNIPDNSLDYMDIWAGFVTFTSPFLYSGYTQIPLGQSFSVTMDALVKNTGGAAQPNIALHLKELNSATTGVSTAVPTTPSLASDTLEVADFYTISAAGTSKIAMYVSSDSLPHVAYKDTFSIVVNTSNNGLYSRDNNYYDGNANWNGVATTGTSVNAFQMANLIEITADTYAKSITAVIAGGSTVNAPVKAILYRGWGQTKTVVAESDYHFLLASEMASTTGANPTAVDFYFNSACPLMTKDSVYFVTIQAFGGTDTVLIASGTNVPQPDYAMYIYDVDNTWYYFGKGNAPAMIRLNTNLANPNGIVEQQKNTPALFQNVPNPANNSTRISYDLTKADNVALDIYDLTGRKVMTLNEGNKSIGVHSIDVNLNDLCSGTYFYTLRTTDFSKTKKMIVKK